jgi:hypothetical protein
MISRTGRLLALLCGLAIWLCADGGTLQLRQSSGPFVLSVFTAPATLRAGNIDFSVLVQQVAGLAPVLDADVEVRAENGDGIIVSKAATHDNAQNKLLYAASLNLSSPGDWTFKVIVRQHDAAAQVSGKLVMEASEPRFLAHWPQWVFVPTLVLLFILHQWLKGRRPVLA